MESLASLQGDVLDVRRRYESLVSADSRRLVMLLSQYSERDLERCQRILLGQRYLDGSWPGIIAELEAVELVLREGSELTIAEPTRAFFAKFLPEHKRDAAIHQWAESLASIYFDAETLLQTWANLGQADVLADMNVLLEMLASFSYGYALNSPGLRQFRQDIVRLRQLLLEQIATWFEQARTRPQMLQVLQFWAVRLAIEPLARSAALALQASEQICLKLLWHKQFGLATALLVGQNGALIATADQQNRITVFDVAGDQVLLQTQTHAASVTSLSLMGDELFVLRETNELFNYQIGESLAPRPNQLHLDVVVGWQRQQIFVHALHNRAATKLRLEQPILKMASDGSVVAVADREGNLFLWEVAGPAGPATSHSQGAMF